jgi:hypothetical protein
LERSCNDQNRRWYDENHVLKILTAGTVIKVVRLGSNWLCLFLHWLGLVELVLSVVTTRTALMTTKTAAMTTTRTAATAAAAQTTNNFDNNNGKTKFVDLGQRNPLLAATAHVCCQTAQCKRAVRSERRDF